MPADSLDARSVLAWAAHDLPVPVDELRAWLVHDASFPDLLARQAALRPDKVALRVDGVSVTYAALVDATARVAGWLGERGVGFGDRVLVAGNSSVELVVACLGVMWAGAAEVVASSALTARELDHIATDAGVVAALADADCLARLERPLPITASLDGGRLLTIVAASPAASPPGLTGSALATLQYTSGTTGVPKGAALSHANIVAYLRSVHLAWRWAEDDVLLHSLPLSHGHGRNGVYTALLAGATAIVLPRTDPDAILATLVEDGATVFYAVPAIWDRLLRAPSFDPAAFRGLRLFTSGSAPLAPNVAARIGHLLGAVPLERYGATETGIVVSNPLDGVRTPGAVGHAMPGAEIRVVDEQGAPVADGAVGEIIVRGPSVFSGYWQQHSSEVFLDDWYRTGDLGSFEPGTGGGLRIAGRSRELIISGGLNVYPREVELAALESEAVHDAGVLGIPSDEWGEEVVMVVVPAAGAEIDPGELRASMRTRLAGYKVPKQVKVVEQLPRNHLGKVSRPDLAAMWDAL